MLREEFNKNKVRLEKDEQILITEYTKIFEEKLVLANFEFETFKDKIIANINLEKNELVKDKTLQDEKTKQLEESRASLKIYKGINEVRFKD